MTNGTQIGQTILAKPKSGPKDVFLQILTMLALYFSAGSFTTIIFQYINISIPDVLAEGEYYYLEGAYRAMRFAISTIIVVFPSYLLLMRYLNKVYEKTPEKRNLGTRKWLIYLTLSVAAIIIVGDLVGLVNKLLEGELTVRFALKVITLLFVAGAVFYFYYSDLKKHQIE